MLLIDFMVSGFPWPTNTWLLLYFCPFSRPTVGLRNLSPPRSPSLYKELLTIMTLVSSAKKSES